MADLVGTGMALWQRFLATRVGRCYQRYNQFNGGLLAGGITYAALFSATASLTIGVTILRAVLGGRPDLYAAVISAADQALPGLLKTSGSPDGLIDPSSLVLDTALTPAAFVSVGVLLWSAIGVMGGLKAGVRAMFGIVSMPENVAVAYLRQLLGFLIFFVAVVSSAVLVVAATAAGQWVFGALGVRDTVTAAALKGVAVLVAAVIDALVYVLVFRVIAAVRVPRRDLLLGAGIGAVLSGVLRLGGTSLMGSVRGPLLTSFAAVVTLLLWIDLAARICLYVAAFTANPPNPPQVDAPDVHAEETPNYVTLSVPETLDWERHGLTAAVDVESDAAGTASSDAEATR